MQQVNKVTFKFEGNEIVKLKQDSPDYNLKAGDCGLLWGVYEFNPPMYEATFIDSDGNESDLMFDENDVEEVLNLSDTLYLERFEEMKRIATEFEAKLERENNI